MKKSIEELRTILLERAHAEGYLKKISCGKTYGVIYRIQIKRYSRICPISMLKYSLKLQALI